MWGAAPSTNHEPVRGKCTIACSGPTPPRVPQANFGISLVGAAEHAHDGGEEDFGGQQARACQPGRSRRTGSFRHPEVQLAGGTWGPG
jgi:hypothetical protein